MPIFTQILFFKYLHWHHRNAREASARLAAPNFRKDMKLPPGYVEQGQTIINNSLQMIETNWLTSADFIASPDPSNRYLQPKHFRLKEAAFPESWKVASFILGLPPPTPELPP